MDACLCAFARTLRLRRVVLCLGLALAVPGARMSHAAQSATDTTSEAEASAGPAPAPVPAREPAGPPPSPLRSRSAVSPTSSPDRLRLGAWRADAALVTAGQLADIASTEIALSRPGTREANPLIANRAVRIPAKLGIAAVTALGCYELRRRGRHGTARALSIVAFAAGAAAAVHNSGIGR